MALLLTCQFISPLVKGEHSTLIIAMWNKLFPRGRVKCLLLNTVLEFKAKYFFHGTEMALGFVGGNKICAVSLSPSKWCLSIKNENTLGFNIWKEAGSHICNQQKHRKGLNLKNKTALVGLQYEEWKWTRRKVSSPKSCSVIKTQIKFDLVNEWQTQQSHL